MAPGPRARKSSLGSVGRDRPGGFVGDQQAQDLVTGTPILSPSPAVVRLAAGPFALEGNLVILDHGFGLYSAMMHLSRINVKPGQIVARGEPIGLVGATGRATGPHLHWGMTWLGVRVDPATLLTENPQ